MKSWATYNGETKRLVLIPSATDEDDARSKVAPPDSDGDEIAVVEVPTTGEPVDVTDLLGINE